MRANICDGCGKIFAKGETFVHVKVFAQTDGLQVLRSTHDRCAKCMAEGFKQGAPEVPPPQLPPGAT